MIFNDKNRLFNFIEVCVVVSLPYFYMKYFKFIFAKRVNSFKISSVILLFIET